MQLKWILLCAAFKIRLAMKIKWEFWKSWCAHLYYEHIIYNELSLGKWEYTIRLNGTEPNWIHETEARLTDNIFIGSWRWIGKHE